MSLDANTWFEIKAAAFYQRHHMLAPGKDQPAALGGSPSDEERSRVWGDWCINNEEIIAAFKTAIERVLCSTDDGGADA
jgi:hypothetical protein